MTVRASIAINERMSIWRCNLFIKILNTISWLKTILVTINCVKQLREDIYPWIFEAVRHPDRESRIPFFTEILNEERKPISPPVMLTRVGYFVRKTNDFITR